MYALRFVFTLLIGFGFLSSINAQVQSVRAPVPKHELRAVWIATVVNIDYPKKPDARRIAQQEEFKNLLDQYHELGFNAVIVQVRTAGDAFYPSDLAPWSAYLTGSQGRAPEPLYDPLEFMIEEAHKRGMEFHAWLNPYRASMNLDSTKLSPKHVFFQHRDWLLTYGTKFYLNPGLPAVQKYIVDVVGEVVDNYDIDAIHFDDYFYPYPIAGESFPDSLTHRFHGRSVTDIGDWRRNNVNTVIQNINTRIKESKPYVLFGISPFGVWRNKDKDSRGSKTNASVSSYDDLYADVLEWMDRRWIDYVMPQLYWNVGFAPADFRTLVQWWSQHSRNTELYIGHGAYKVGTNKELAWHQPGEIPQQIDMVRRNFQTTGSAFFSAKSILSNPLNLKDSIRSIYRYPALPPQRDQLSAAPARKPTIKRTRYRKNQVELRWDINPADLLEKPAYFVIYRFTGDAQRDYDNPANILTTTPFQLDCVKYNYRDNTTDSDKRYTYAITAVNRAHIESDPAFTRTYLRTQNGMKLWRGASTVKNARPKREKKDKPKKNNPRRIF